MTACQNDIDNHSVLTITGEIESIDKADLFKSEYYIIGRVEYLRTDKKGNQMLPGSRSLWQSAKTRVVLGDDQHFELNYLVEDLDRKTAKLSIVSAKLYLRKITGDFQIDYPIEFSEDGIIKLSEASYSLEVKEIDLD